jgi:hypothetical protein
MAEDHGHLDKDEGDGEVPFEVTAGISCTPLLAQPPSWIRRRVETIDMLAHEEIHRRVSIDLALSHEQYEALAIDDGVAVPISVLSKERRRNFSLRDEAGRAIPVLGKQQNGNLAHIALLSAAYDALLAQKPPLEVLEMLSADLRQVVMLPREEALETLAYLERAAEADDPWRTPILEDPVCKSLLRTLSQNYVLFAVLPPDGPARRILKYSYSEDFTGSVKPATWWERVKSWLRGVWLPDRRQFVIECPGAGRAASFHLEITTAEELRFAQAVLFDDDTGLPASSYDRNVNRASLYPPEPVDEFGLDAFVEVAPERTGATSQAAVTSLIVAALLWAGYLSGLDATTPGPAVSLLVGGAALFSGVTATRGEHRLVKKVFFWTRFWLTIVTIAGLAASASLALEIPDKHPTEVWIWAAIICSVAAAQRVWAAIRSPA